MVLECFEMWFSVRRWELYSGPDPERFRVQLLTSIAKLKMSFRELSA